MANTTLKRFKCPAHWTHAQRMAHYSRPGQNGCILWIGRRNVDGYGMLTVKGVTQKTHRFAWEAANGPIPDGLHVLHTCDTPACVNPDHLFLGTHTENMADRTRKRRHAIYHGESHGGARLTNDEVRAIRSAAGAYRDIGKCYGVSGSTVYRIKNGKAWNHLP
jgi:hypothetical protein